ncbi:MAG: hypothetical protein HY727_07890 [Candidatus Rokubacteria bacterium]|nr:hypothetical protein [Candidatus Rokubacteria bacterium]
MPRGLTHLDEARAILDPSRARDVPWHQQRAGSLRSLNQIAAHLGLRLLEDFVGERLDRSVWLRVEFDHQGMLRQEILSPPGRACALCAQVGLGDDVLAAERISSW